MGHSVHDCLRLDRCLFMQSYRRGGKFFGHRYRRVGGCGGGIMCGISLLVALTFILKWEAKPLAESQEGKECDGGLEREDKLMTVIQRVTRVI